MTNLHLASLARFDGARFDGLINLLKDRNAFVRQHAVLGLMWFSRKNPKVCSAIAQMFKDKDSIVRWESITAYSAMCSTNPEDTRARLEKMVNDPDPQVRDEVQAAVDRLGKNRSINLGSRC